MKRSHSFHGMKTVLCLNPMMKQSKRELSSFKRHRQHHMMKSQQKKNRRSLQMRIRLKNNNQKKKVIKMNTNLKKRVEKVIQTWKNWIDYKNFILNVTAT